MPAPAFSSLALDEISDPDYTHVVVDVLPAHATADPAAWARALMSTAALPRWLAAAIALVALAGRGSATRPALRVRRVEGEEALICLDGRRYDARIAVGVDENRALVRVVTTLRFKGRAADALFLPMRMMLPFVARSMVAHTRRELSGVTR